MKTIHFLKNRNNFLLKVGIWVLLAVFLLYMGYLAHVYSQSQRFVDEVGHFIGGHFILKGKLLYRDLQFNHQPLLYYFSAITEKLSSPANLYFYIARQREAIFMYGALWLVAFTYFFGYRGFIFSILFEMSTYFFQGYKLLGETLAAYPTAFVFFLLIYAIMEKKKLNPLHLILASLGFFIIVFSLSQLWPFVALTGLVLISLLWKDKMKLIYFIVPGLLCTAILFTFVPFGDYFRETVTYNFQYLLPSLDRNASLLSTVLFPIYTALPPYINPPHIVIALGTIILLVYTALMYKQLGWKVFIILGLLWSANTRADQGWYDSFHILPWIAGLGVVDIYFVSQSTKIFKDKIPKLKFIHAVAFMLIVTWLLFTIPNPVEARKKITTENYINYSYSETTGRVVRLLKNEGDTLFIIEDDPIVYWVADIEPATHVLEYYSWILDVPVYGNEIISIMSNNQPAFVVDTGFIDKKIEMPSAEGPQRLDKKLEEVLNKDYVFVRNTVQGASGTDIYIRKDRLKNITNNKRKQLKDMLFELPE